MPPTVEDYKIGIICALPKELAAVQAIIDEEYGFLGSKDGCDHNCYTLGRIHGHKVAAACLPAGAYGTNMAATVAKDMLRTFTGLRVSLMVGIGGGIPNLPDHDIRLGDVVVSQPKGAQPGVVQYDLGSIHKDGHIEQKGILNNPPIALLTALSTLQARHYIHNSQISTYIDEAYQRFPALLDKGYSFPGIETDRLHCSRCDSSWLHESCKYCPIVRSPRSDKYPVIHYGTIASGNLLIKNAEFRDQLRQTSGAKCVEMEAAGLMNEFPCIVIRGICDYADSYKNDKWQEYAALAAAAFAKELLYYVATGSVDREQPMNKHLGALSKQVDHLQETVRVIVRDKPLSRITHLDDEYRKCHRALKTSTYEDFKNINPDRADGTCRWVLSHKVFCKWRDSLHDDLLWISAGPGCGKSALAKSLIDLEFPKDGNLRICYYFFKDNESQNSLASALCALLHQLFSFEPLLIRHAMPAWNKNEEKLTMEVEELWRILFMASNDPLACNVICVLDALDECKDADRSRLIRKLTDFHKRSSSARSLHTPSIRIGRLKFLVTSRPYDDIQRDFGLPVHLPVIRLRGEDENDQIHREINIVVEARVEALAMQYSLDDQTKNDLKTRLLQMEHRTYLWLYLAIGSIEENFSGLSTEDALIERLPSTVEDAYQNILRKVSKKHEKDVKIILQIVVGAKRPLTIGEMAVALKMAKSPDLTRLNHSKAEEVRLQNRIRQVCGLFVTISGSRVYLIHQTAKKFLLREMDEMKSPHSWARCLDPAEIEATAASICINFLLLDEVVQSGKSLIAATEPLFKNPYREAYYEKSDTIQSLLLYSVEHWASHFSKVRRPINGSLLRNARKLYGQGSHDATEWWFRIYIPVLHQIGISRKLTAFGFAALNGHTEILDWFCQQDGVSIDDTIDGGLPAIAWASLSGQKSTVQFLLDKGATTDARCRPTDDSALVIASVRGHKDIAELLLDRGADVKIKALRHDSVLEAASAAGYSDIVELLLDRGADVNAQSRFDGSALVIASYLGHREIVKILLDRGANVNFQGGLYGGALAAASARGHKSVVELLLDRGADINAETEFYESAVAAAFTYNQRAIFELLLSRGADVKRIGRRIGHKTSDTIISRSPRANQAAIRPTTAVGTSDYRISKSSNHHRNVLQPSSRLQRLERTQHLQCERIGRGDTQYTSSRWK